MAIWNKLRSELDRAGRVAHDAIDEGKLRLDVFRARQLVDRAAQALGYAVYRARTGLEAADEASLARLTDAVQERERDVAVLEERIRQASRREGASHTASDPDPAREAAPAPHTEPAPGTDAPGANAEASPPTQ